MRDSLLHQRLLALVCLCFSQQVFCNLPASDLLALDLEILRAAPMRLFPQAVFPASVTSPWATRTAWCSRSAPTSKNTLA